MIDPFVKVAYVVALAARRGADLEDRQVGGDLGSESVKADAEIGGCGGFIE